MSEIEKFYDDTAKDILERAKKCKAKVAVAKAYRKDDLRKYVVLQNMATALGVKVKVELPTAYLHVDIADMIEQQEKPNVYRGGWTTIVKTFPGTSDDLFSENSLNRVHTTVVKQQLNYYLAAAGISDRFEFTWRQRNWLKAVALWKRVKARLKRR